MKLDEQQEDLDELPLPAERMREMFDMLDEQLPERGCDHSLRLVRGWATENDLSLESIEAWCRDTSGFCDCEVLANSEEAFLAALGEL